MSDWAVTPHPVPPELEPGFPHALPPDHKPDLAEMDEDRHPHGSWTVGEVLDTDTLALLRALRDNLDQA